MFGADDDQQQPNDDPAMLDNVKQLASEPADQVEPAPTPSAPPAEPTAATAVAEPAQGFSTPAPAPEPAPAAGTAPQPDPTPPTTDLSPTSPPAVAATPAQPTNDDTPVDEPATDTTSQPAGAVDPTHLAGLKQEALDHLEPLADHIDGSPEETFNTTMMMIQANDNHTLLEKALTAAKKIEDDKVRAQAMLDIINEINYFAQNSEAD